MHTDDFPFLTDWFSISLRWFSLVGIVTALAIAGTLVLPQAGIVLFSALWNFGLSIMAMLNKRMPGHRLWNVTIDIIVSISLFILANGINGPLAWSGILCLFSAAIYYEMFGSLLVSIIIISLQSGWTIYQYIGIEKSFQLTQLGPIVLLCVSSLVFSFILGILSRSLLKFTRQNYRSQLRARNELKTKAQSQERDRLQTFYKMAEALSSTLNYQVVLETALDLSIEALARLTSSNAQTVCAFLLFGESGLKVAAARGFPSRDMRLALTGDQGALFDALKRGEPQLVRNPVVDPELCKLQALQPCNSVLCLPLLRGMNAYGVMILGHPEPGVFATEWIGLLEMVSHQAVIAIQNARLYQELEQEKERIIASEDEARKQLARALHDGPTQSVSSIAMRINVVRYMMDKDVKEAAKELVDIEELARRTTKEIRHMLFTLRPLILESQGLIPALEAMAEKMRDTYQQKVVVEANPASVKLLDENKQSIIFQLTEEALNNARKHAQASQIQVKLNYMPQDQRFLLLEIIDDGVGFDVKAVTETYEKRDSFGMVNLQERTDLINGLLRIDSAPGKGTRVRVYIPVNDEAADLLQHGKAIK